MDICYFKVGQFLCTSLAWKQLNTQDNFLGGCTFENGRCTWTNAATGDDFDWKEGSGRTDSTGTGPTNDHTLGTTQGKPSVYLYRLEP